MLAGIIQPTQPTSLTPSRKFFTTLSNATSAKWYHLTNAPKLNVLVSAMTILVARVVRTRWRPQDVRLCARSIAMSSTSRTLSCGRCMHMAEKEKKPDGDPRINILGRAIEDDFATIKENYATPKHPIVLAHGLMGFDELRIIPKFFPVPPVHYWRGITDALRGNGIEVITASVPALGSIEERAAKLGKDIAAKANGKSVNIIAHSMGGLDARYMISQLQPDNVEVLSLTTVATPHRGSAYADYCFQEIGPDYLPHLYKFFDRLGISTGAFSQLTRRYMAEEFNPKTPDAKGVRYFSYGATFNPSFWSAFRQPHKIVQKLEGVNDGLVSVESAKWGTYKGTLVNVSHLDLINWTNRIKWAVSQLSGNERKFNAIAFYLDLADMLAKEGL